MHAIKGMHKLAIVMNSKSLKETCETFLFNQITNGHIKEEGEFKYMPISDISRGYKAFNYTYSSLTWMYRIWQGVSEEKRAPYKIHLIK